jgi:phage baseplate assembly protein W
MLQLSANVSATTLPPNGQGRANLTLTYTATDTDPFITQGQVTIEWGDGQSTVVGPSTLPLSGEVEHGYTPGRYTVRVTARNFRTRPQITQVHRDILVQSVSRVVTDAAPVLFGPILPQTNAYPGTSEWAFQTGRDETVLSSSLLMLVYTRQGERVHDPAYGTRLHQIIFALADEDLASAVRQELADAVARHEPRVELIHAQVSRDPTGRTVQVQAEFVSRLSGQPLVLDLGFAA